MGCKRIIKIAVLLLVLQIVSYAVFSRYGDYASLFSKYCEHVISRNFTSGEVKISNNDIGFKTVKDINEASRKKSLQTAEPTASLSKKDTTFRSVHEKPTLLGKIEVISISTTGRNSTINTNIRNVSKNKITASLTHEVADLLKTQLELNTTTEKFEVKIKCVPNPTWNYACVHPNCSQLNNNVEQRVQSLLSEKTMLTKDQDALLRFIAAQIPENDVILLTAASSNHFDEMQAMLHSLHSVVFPELSKQENFSLVLWDIGLSPAERNKTEKCCRCQVISFPFDKFPKVIRDLRCYMWKPLVIRMTQLRARKYVVWQDASIRYTHFPGTVFEKGRQYGLQLLRQRGGVSAPHRTLPETFAYLGQKVCDFYPYPEIASGFGVYKQDPFVLKAVTDPWARCGLEQACMCPKPSILSHRCHYGPCHRFDQSALSIITATLYSREIYRIVLFEPEFKQYFWVGRNNKEANYFNSTGCISN